MKLLIAGSGFIVEDWLPITVKLQDTELVGISATERSLSKMQKMAKEYQIQNVYTDYEEALDKSGADTVYVAVTNSLHYTFTKKALLAGKNVICEKPFTVDYGEFKELYNLALEKDLVLLEAITNVYLPNFRLLKEQVSKIGDIKIVSMNYSQYSHRYDNFKKGIIEPVFDPKKGGGALMDLNVYNIHLLAALFGMPKTVEYEANISNGVDTSGILLLDYGDFKAVSIAAKDSGAPITSVFEGERASLVINGPTNSFESFDLYHNSEKLAHFEEHNDPHRMFDEFACFEKIIQNHDMKRVKKELDHSDIVMQILDKARRDLNIS